MAARMIASLMQEQLLLHARIPLITSFQPPLVAKARLFTAVFSQLTIFIADCLGYNFWLYIANMSLGLIYRVAIASCSFKFCTYCHSYHTALVTLPYSVPPPPLCKSVCHSSWSVVTSVNAPVSGHQRLHLVLSNDESCWVGQLQLLVVHFPFYSSCESISILSWLISCKTD